MDIKKINEAAPFEMAFGFHAKEGTVKYTAFANNFKIL